MASDERKTIRYFLQHDDFGDEIDGGSDHPHYDHQHHSHSISRLSVCTSSSVSVLDAHEEDDVDDARKMYSSRLSIESFDADVESSDGKELPARQSSDSENELGSCYSLPATPPRRRNTGGLVNQKPTGVKDYASENEVQKKSDTRRRNRNRRTRIPRDRYGNNNKKQEGIGICMNNGHSFSGESDHSGGGGSSGIMIITRPKGGSRSLCLDLEEVKACEDLGFELEQERMLEISTRHSVSNSTLETSSGGNSPIASWRISSPGDDPRDVKARLKMWAQAVALVSTSRYGN